MKENMNTTTTTATITTGFRTLRMAGSEWYVEFNIVDGVSEITDAHHTDGPSSNMTMERLNEQLAEQLADEANEIHFFLKIKGREMNIWVNNLDMEDMYLICAELPCGKEVTNEIAPEDMMQAVQDYMAS